MGEAAGHAEAVVRVLKFRWDARAGGAARDFCVVPPGSASRGPARAGDRTLRVALRRDGVVAGIEPVGAPFMHVCANIEKAVGVELPGPHGLGAGFPACGVVRKRFRRFVTPGELLLIETAAGGALPLSFGGQTKIATDERAQPLAISSRIKPGNRNDGLARIGKARILPMGWRTAARRAQKWRVFRIADLAFGQFERIDPHTAHGAFVVLPGCAAHPEPSFGNASQARSNKYIRSCL